MLDVLDSIHPFVVYMMPLLLGIGLYLTPILYYFDLDNRDVYHNELGFELEVPDHQVNMLGTIMFANILFMDVIAYVVIVIKTRKSKNK